VCVRAVAPGQMESELQVMAEEVDLLRSRNVDLEVVLLHRLPSQDGHDPPSDATKLRRQCVEQGRQLVVLDREVKQLRIATCKLDVYKRCVQAEAAQLKSLLRWVSQSPAPPYRRSLPPSCAPAGLGLVCLRGKEGGGAFRVLVPWGSWAEADCRQRWRVISYST
jgi:hypothetical protein